MSAAVIATANANIALVKYWGKRGPASLNLPAVGSLSITLGDLQTTTSLAPVSGVALDEYLRGGEPRPQEALRVVGFLDKVRDMAGRQTYFRVESDNNFPTGAGLASSASGFAALAKAANAALELELDDRALSVLARQGSGSAARSLFGGFVRMHRGEREDGDDAFAEPLFDADHWPLRVIVAVTAEGEKHTGSTEGMRLTADSSSYFESWVRDQHTDLVEAEAAIAGRDFEKLADVTEYSCLKMHASAMAAKPGVIYWNAATLAGIETLRRLRGAGTPVTFTVDAGPQVKAICLPEAELQVAAALADVPGVQRIISTGLGGPARLLA